MGAFLRITSESQFAGTHVKNRLMDRVVSYITDYIGDESWQDSISSQLRNIVGYHTTLGVILRFFDMKNIGIGKLKSFARYIKKDDKLIIDQMLVLNNYTDLPEDEMRKAICNDVFDYLQEVLIKYEKRFLDFDSKSFIPLLKERIDKIKENQFPFDYYENTQIAQQLKKLAEEEENS